VVNAHPFKKTFIVKDILDNRAPLLIKLDENNNIQPICSMDALVNNIETSSTYYTSSFSYDGAFLEVSTYEKKGF